MCYCISNAVLVILMKHIKIIVFDFYLYKYIYIVFFLFIYKKLTL